MATSPQLREGFRYLPALDGVRALAVLAVLAFHGGMPWARGGFLGVDAFFVLSGFLITSLLVAEWERTGTLSLGAFWARRARRLLPALLLVICVLAVTAPMLLPAAEVRSAPRRRARGAVLRRELADDPARRRLLRPDLGTLAPRAHLVARGRGAVLPRLAAAPGGPARRDGDSGPRRHALRRVLVFCGLVAVASTVLLAAGYDPMDPGRAYYGTDTRAASLVIGAGLAVVLARYRPQAAGWVASRRVRRALGVLAAGAVLVLAWAWTHADGGDRWLYRGGLAGAGRGGRGGARARRAGASRLAGSVAGPGAAGPPRPNLVRRVPLALAGLHRGQRRPHRHGRVASCSRCAA